MACAARLRTAPIRSLANQARIAPPFQVATNFRVPWTSSAPCPPRSAGVRRRTQPEMPSHGSTRLSGLGAGRNTADRHVESPNPPTARSCRGALPLARARRWYIDKREVVDDPPCADQRLYRWRGASWLYRAGGQANRRLNQDATCCEAAPAAEPETAASVPLAPTKARKGNDARRRRSRPYAVEWVSTPFPR